MGMSHSSEFVHILLKWILYSCFIISKRITNSNDGKFKKWLNNFIIMLFEEQNKEMQHFPCKPVKKKTDVIGVKLSLNKDWTEKKLFLIKWLVVETDFFQNGSSCRYHFIAFFFLQFIYLPNICISQYINGYTVSWHLCLLLQINCLFKLILSWHVPVIKKKSNILDPSHLYRFFLLLLWKHICAAAAVVQIYAFSTLWQFVLQDVIWASGLWALRSSPPLCRTLS